VEVIEQPVSDDDLQVLIEADWRENVSLVSFWTVSLRDGTVLRKYKIEHPPSLAVAFASGHDRAVTLDRAGSASIWDLRKGLKVGGYAGTGRAWCADLTPDGRYAVVAFQEGHKVFENAITLHQVSSGQEAWEQQRDGEPPEVIRVSPDRLLVVVAVGTALDVLNGRTGRLLRNLEIGHDSIHVMAFCAGGKRVVVGGGRRDPKRNMRGVVLEDNRWMELWDLETGKRIWSLQPEVDPVHPIP
jgi:hypothetical protein